MPSVLGSRALAVASSDGYGAILVLQLQLRKTMTAQISHKVEYRGTTYSLVEVHGSGLFDPRELGLRTIPTSTADWRGFHCRYRVAGSRLVLDTVRIGLKDSAPPLFSREAVRDRGLNSWTYTDLCHKVSFSGDLVLGHGFIRELYDHMGFHPRWRYTIVLKMEFEEGRLIAVADESEATRRPGATSLFDPEPGETGPEPTDG